MTIPLHELTAAFSAGVTVLLALLLFYWVWQQYVIDSTRQRLFELRDELFDMATDGELERDGEPYQMLREMLNTGIRFAHQLTVWRLLVLMTAAILVGERKVGRHAKHILEGVHSIQDQRVRTRVSTIVQKQNTALVLHILKRSLLLLVVVPLATLLLIVVSVGLEMSQKALKKLSLVISASVFYSET